MCKGLSTEKRVNIVMAVNTFIDAIFTTRSFILGNLCTRSLTAGSFSRIFSVNFELLSFFGNSLSKNYRNCILYRETQNSLHEQNSVLFAGTCYQQLKRISFLLSANKIYDVRSDVSVFLSHSVRFRVLNL